MPNQKLIDGKVVLRPDEVGSFDELLMYIGPAKCVVHAEMMHDGCLWIGFYPPDRKKRRAVMWTAKGSKLKITAEED